MAIVPRTLLRSVRCLSVFALALAAFPTAAWAEDDDEQLEGEKEDDREEGWDPGIAIGGTFNFNHARAVIGQPEGLTLTLGAIIDASLDFNHGMHEWRNTLSASAGAARTPGLDEFQKADDDLELESLYLLHLLKRFGPYGRFAMDTSMFPGADLQTAPVTYVVANVDGSSSTFIGRRLALTDPFQPTTFREGIGVFAQPVSEEQLDLEFKAGIGAQETLASGVALTDDSATPVIEAKELDNSAAVGGEVLADAEGFFDKTKYVAFNASVSALFPFYTTSLPVGDDRSLIELTTFEADLGLTAKVFDWASVGYKFGVLREPLVADQWQVTNTIVLSIGAAFGSKAPVPPPKVPCDCVKDCPIKPPPAAPEAPPANPAPASSGAVPVTPSAPLGPAPIQPTPPVAPANPAPP